MASRDVLSCGRKEQALLPLRVVFGLETLVRFLVDMWCAGVQYVVCRCAICCVPVCNMLCADVQYVVCRCAICGVPVCNMWCAGVQYVVCRCAMFILSYNKSQQDALFLNFILVKTSTCFGQIYCTSSGVLILYSQQ